MVDQGLATGCAEQKEKYGYAPNPSCEVCGGAGAVHPIFESGKPDYARVINCPAEGCLESQKRVFASTEAHAKSKGGSKFASFDNFELVFGASETVAAFKDIALNEEAPPLLIVYGPTGNGKTHLCEATLIKLLERGIDARLWAVADLVSNLKMSITDNTTEKMIDNLKHLPALILDEWGQNRESVWEVQKLEEIVIARERAGLITIITTNLELVDLPERIVSRGRDPAEALILLNSAPDFRPKKKLKRRKR